MFCNMRRRRKKKNFSLRERVRIQNTEVHTEVSNKEVAQRTAAGQSVMEIPLWRL